MRFKKLKKAEEDTDMAQEAKDTYPTKEAVLEVTVNCT